MRLTAIPCLVLVACVGAQTQIYVPDNTPTAGICNSFPFGNTTFTYMARVPASFIPAQTPVVDEISFAPCNSGTWSAPQVKIALGHVPNPLPLPFTFPTISSGAVTNPGSFLDATVVHDSDTAGVFTWSYVQGTWSPLGLSALGGSGFVWDGLNDVGFYITLTNATGTSSMHRTNTEPFRAYTSGVYQAATSSATGFGQSGLKMCFDLLAAAPTVPMVTVIGTGCSATAPSPLTLSTTQLPYIGNNLFSLDVTQAPANELAWNYFALGTAPNPISLGSGCFLYLDPVSLEALVLSGFSPIGPLPTGAGGATSFFLPIPNLPGLAGAVITVQSAVTDPGAAAGFVLSNALELTIN